MCCISMPLHLYTVMSRIPALIATHANRWFIIGGSEEKIKIKNQFYFKHSICLQMWINTDLQLYIHVDMPFFFFFFWNHWVHVAYILHTCIDMSYLQVLNFEFIGYVTIREKKLITACKVLLSLIFCILSLLVENIFTLRILFMESIQKQITTAV